MTQAYLWLIRRKNNDEEYAHICGIAQKISPY